MPSPSRVNFLRRICSPTVRKHDTCNVYGPGSVSFVSVKPTATRSTNRGFAYGTEIEHNRSPSTSEQTVMSKSPRPENNVIKPSFFRGCGETVVSCCYFMYPYCTETLCRVQESRIDAHCTIIYY